MGLLPGMSSLCTCSILLLLLMLGIHLLLGLVMSCQGAASIFLALVDPVVAAVSVVVAGTVCSASLDIRGSTHGGFSQLGHLVMVISLALWQAMHSSVEWDRLHTPHLAAWLKHWHL